MSDKFGIIPDKTKAQAREKPVEARATIFLSKITDKK